MQHKTMENALRAMIRAVEENSLFGNPSLELICLNMKDTIKVELQNPHHIHTHTKGKIYIFFHRTFFC